MNHATADGTKRYFLRFPQISPNQLGSTGLEVSPVGFGGYRVSDVEPSHREALMKALSSGINLIDTSTNYGDGGSERLVGDALRDLLAEGKVARDEIIVVTKCGYVQGASLEEARRRLASRSPFPEMVEYRPDCWHCISPDFLSDQIAKSLERMRIEKIDVLLLHNPEYFLKAGGARDEYDRRLQKAFARLEEEADAGRIRYYGVSSNGFPEQENKTEYTSLETVLELARSAALVAGRKQTRFAVAEFPLNIFETGAALLANNAGKTVLEVARAKKIGVLANRPLNAYRRGRVVRLSSFKKHDEVETKGEMHRLLGRAIELEKKRLGDRSYQGLGWAHALRDKIGELDDVLQWREALSQQIYPTLATSLERAQEREPAWTEEYRPIIRDLLNFVGKDLETAAAKRAEVLASQMAGFAPSLASSTTLSQMAVRAARSFPGVTSVLIGMRQPEYVDDALALQAPIPHVEATALAQALLRKN